MDADNADDIALLAKTPAQPETLLHSKQQSLDTAMWMHYMDVN